MRLLRYVEFVLVAAVFSLPLFVGLGRTDLQNDEGTHSFSAESILETGDWFNPRSSPDPTVAFIEKPPLKFWLVALGLRLGVLPHNEFGLRFWDALFGGIAFLYVYALGRRMAGPLCGITALLVLYSFDGLIFEHGVRSANMDAAVTLAYCAGVYHFLRWCEATDSRSRARHTLAVALWFVLGFMTKFVAVLFLPLILLASSLMVDAVRVKLLREWRSWLVASAVACALIAPWFIYQAVQPDRSLWQVMFAQHVYQRFHSWLDPQHLHPWNYYFTQLYEAMHHAGTLWLVVAGAALVFARLVREQWHEGTVVVFWFLLPFALMSIGTSKLFHYTYPFLAPVALAAGYAPGWALQVGGAVMSGRPADWEAPVDAVPAALRAHAWLVQRLQPAFAPLVRIVRRVVTVLGTVGVVRIALYVLSAACVALAAVTVFREVKISVGDVTLLRNTSVVRPVIYAIILGILARRGSVIAHAAVGVMLLMLAPVSAYQTTLPNLVVEHHPWRSARDCMKKVYGIERQAGRQPKDVVFFIPEGFFQHQYFYYFRELNWNLRTRDMTDTEIASIIDDAPEQRPLLMPVPRYEQFLLTRRTVPAPLRVRDSNMVLLMPGPFAPCGVE